MTHECVIIFLSDFSKGLLEKGSVELVLQLASIFLSLDAEIDHTFKMIEFSVYLEQRQQRLKLFSFGVFINMELFALLFQTVNQTLLTVRNWDFFC
jgi:hypothetical protein